MTNTKERTLMDALIAAVKVSNGPEVMAAKEQLASVNRERHEFITSSVDREKALLARQAKERDDFSKAELKTNEAFDITEKRCYSEIENAEGAMAKAWADLRTHWINEAMKSSDGQKELSMIFEGKPMVMGFDIAKPGADITVEHQIRRVLTGQDDKAAKVETVVTENGDLVTRIRRGVHYSDLDQGAVRPVDQSMDINQFLFVDAESAPATLGPNTIGDALEQAAEAIGEDVGELGLDFETEDGENASAS